jgi:hypothetical protein
MRTETTELIPHNTATAMVDAYLAASEDIRKGFKLLDGASDRLNAAFGDNYRFGVYGYEGIDTTVEKLLDKIKKAAWRAVVDKVNLRQLMSTKKAKELDDWLDQKPSYHQQEIAPMPELSVEAIYGMLQHSVENMDDYLRDAIKEVFDFLRPGKTYMPYKTNKEFTVGRKVILGSMVRWDYGKFAPSYYRDQQYRCLENVFSLLDGKGPIKTHKGGLYDAVSTSHGTGETEYFRFKCFRNCNLHLEFKRLDLLEKLNEIGGGDSKQLPVDRTKAAA